jgi:DnaJ-domain-containing protein 1
MSDEFLTLAGPAPARGDPDRWRQVALFGVSAAAFGDERARIGLGASLLALDYPNEAGRLLGACVSDDPWARWWTVLAVGQAGAGGLEAALGAARAEVVPRGEGREVARRLADLEAELRALTGQEEDSARFAVLGHRARPTRRALIGGRSSAVFLLDPSWDSVRLVRLAPSDGPGAGNAAHLTFAEVLEAVRRGESGPGRRVCDDAPSALEPGPMLEALREDPATRDGRLLRLATEVKEERERLADERASLAAARAEIADEGARLRRAREAASANGGAAERRQPPKGVPTTAAEAAALLGVSVDASRTTIQRHWRDQVAKCHPDRVEGLHPSLRQRAADLAVALNAARDLLLGHGTARRAGRRG